MMDQQTIKIRKDYLRYLRLQRSVSPNTLEAYALDLDKLLVYLEHEGKRATDVELADLQSFAAGLHDVGIGPRSQCRILSGMRSFYRFLVIDGYMESDPTELLESPVQGEHLPEFLSELRGMTAAFGEYKLTIIQCDVAIHSVKVYSNDDPLPEDGLAFHGFGGTSFIAPFRYVE